MIDEAALSPAGFPLGKQFKRGLRPSSDVSPSCKHALNYQGLHVPGRLPNYRCFRNASAQVPVALRMMDDIFTLPHKRVKMPWRVRDWEVEKCWSWKEIYFMASGEVGLS